MGSIRIIGMYNPTNMNPKMMSSEMANRVEAWRLAE
jgi:hypothetical protein